MSLKSPVSVVDYLEIDNSLSQFATLRAVGVNTNVSLRFESKGVGVFRFLPNNVAPAAGFVKNDNQGDLEFAQTIAMSDLSSSTLNDLSDVTITTPATGSVLKYDGAGWIDDDEANLDRINTPNGLFAVVFTDKTDSVRGFQIIPGTVSEGVQLNTAGTGSPIDMELNTKGTGDIIFGSDFGSTELGRFLGTDSGLELSDASAAVYWGVNDVDGTWRIFEDGGDLDIQLRVSSVYNEISRFSSAGFHSTDISVSSLNTPNGLFALVLTDVASSVVGFQMLPDILAGAPSLNSAGTGSVIDMKINTKGDGNVIFGTDFGSTEIARLNAAGVSLPSSEAYHLGDPDVDGTWRFVRSGSDLKIERRETGSYVSKTTITA